MSDKVLIRTIIGIVAFIIILMLTIFLIQNRKTGTTSYHDKVREEKINAIEKGEISGKYSSNNNNYTYINLTQEERDNIDIAIDEVFDLINKKDADTLYNFLDDDYKRVRFPQKEDLVIFLEDFFEREKSYKVDSYELVAKNLYVKLLDTSDESRSKYFRIDNYNATENMKVYFDNFSHINNLNSNCKFNDVAVDNYKSIVYDNKASLVFIIYNHNDKKVTIDFSDTTIYATSFGTSSISKVFPNSKCSFELEPNSKNVCEVYFTPTGSNIEEIRYNVSINGENYTKTCYVRVGGMDEEL